VPHNTLLSPLVFPYTILPYVFFGWTAVGLGSYLLGRQPAVSRGEQFTVRAAPAPVPAAQPVGLPPGRAAAAAANLDND
jgi:hypothetical protein